MASRVLSASAAGTGGAEPGILTRFQADIDRYLRSTALPIDSLAGKMAAYHMGWIDSDGKPTTGGPGKLVRPSLCLWACEANGGDVSSALPVAAALEWTHNFTLIHDDIQDGDRVRRHRPTVWSVWDAAQGINAGDALHALAFRTLTQDGPYPERQLRAAHVIAQATLATVEGQCLDLSLAGRLDASLRSYLQVVGLKTAALLGASLEAGAVMAAAPPRAVANLRSAGRLLGKAFQIRDDWLGVWGDPTATGKSADGDVDQRKITYPIVAGYAAMTSAQRERLGALFAPGAKAAGSDIKGLLEEAGGPELTASAPRRYAEKAIAHIERARLDIAHTREFIGVAQYVANRLR